MKISKLTAKIGLLAVFSSLVVFFLPSVYASNQLVPLEQQSIDQYKSGLLPGPYGDDVDSLELTKELIFEDLLGYAKIIIGIVGILLITIIGYQIIFANGDEEKIKKGRQSLTFVILGLVIVSISQDLARVFDMENSTFIENPNEILDRVRIFDNQVEVIITFIKYIIATFAALMIVRSAAALIVSGGNEEETTKHRKNIGLSAGALLLIYIGDIFINRVFYKIDKQVYNSRDGITLGVDPEQGVAEIVSITNLVVTFLGPVAILMLVVGGLMYITAGGEDDRMQKAKRVLIATAVGIVIIYGAFAIVNTALVGRLPITE